MKGTRELAKASDAECAGEQRDLANVSSGLDQRKTNKQTIASMVKPQSQTRESEREVDNNTAMNNEMIDATNQPLTKSQMR